MNRLWDFLFPPLCMHCGDEVAHEGAWCEACFQELWKPRHIHNSSLPYIDELVVLSPYKGGMKTLLHDVKFNTRKERARGAAPFLHRFMELWLGGEYFEQWMPDYVVPVPVSHKKAKARGYNQVDELFLCWREGGEAYPFIWCDCLHKLDFTQSMWGLGKQERKANMEGAFIVKADYRSKDALAGKEVLLIDDIYTTGATLHEISGVLKEEGVTTIKALTLSGGA